MKTLYLIAMIVVVGVSMTACSGSSSNSASALSADEKASLKTMNEIKFMKQQ